MTNTEARITQALSLDTPPAQDPGFRLAVLARREARQFQRYAWRTFGAVAGLVGSGLLVLTLGDEVYGTAAVLVCVLVVLTRCAIHAPTFGRLLRHLSL